MSQSSDLNFGTFNRRTGEAVPTEALIRTIGTTFATYPDEVDHVYSSEKITYKRAIYDMSEPSGLSGYKPTLLKQILAMLT